MSRPSIHPRLCILLTINFHTYELRLLTAVRNVSIFISLKYSAHIVEQFRIRAFINLTLMFTLPSTLHIFRKIYWWF